MSTASRPAEATPSGPSGHLPLEGGETPAPAAAPSPSPSGDKPGGEAGRVTVSKTVERRAAAAPAEPAPQAAPRTPWFQRLREGLSRSSRELSSSISGVFTKRRLDEDTLQDLEDVLIQADLGMETAIRVTDALSSSRYGRDVSDAEVRAIMATEIEKVLTPVAMPLELDLSHKPHVILVVGVNGTGKTTTIGKLAAKLTDGGLSVMLAAGDTFRAAAIEQLKIWGERTGSPVVSSKLGADAAGLAYDAFEKAKEAGSDVLVIDTAGRLQNKAELMAELEKIVRVLGKLDPDAPHTVLADGRRHHRPERAQPGRDFQEHRRRQRAGDDQARRHGARRHPRRHRRQAQAAGLLHRRRRAGRGSGAVLRRRFRQGNRGSGVVRIC